MADTIQEYNKKRKFEDTPEPKGKVIKSQGELRFVIQKHAASHLHYDFRLEMEGVLKSWAVPKGPSLRPEDKRLAMMVEDHPIEYGKFEGIIPTGNYGAGTVMVWDEGTYQALEEDDKLSQEDILLRGLQNGNLKVVMNGTKIKGEFALVKLKSDRSKGNEWLLIKHKDKFAKDIDVTIKDKSVLTKRTLERIAKDSGEGDSVWNSNSLEKSKGSDKSKNKKPAIKKIKNNIGLNATMPHEIEPMLATLVDEAFDSPDWLYEIKWDGYRAIAEVDKGEVSLYSRNKLSFNESFPEIVSELKSLGIQTILDGEIVALDKDGISKFQLIQNYKSTSEGNIVFYVFDILFLEGKNLMDLQLTERKEILKKLLANGNKIRYNDHILENGIDFFKVSEAKGLEGIIAKRKTSIYHEGSRSKDWLKIKTQKRQEAVIAGFTEPRGGRKFFGALVLGMYKNKKLTYVGHTGSGFNHALLKEIFKLLEPLQQEECPFIEEPKTNMPVTWVSPKLICEIKFQEWTSDGIMRIPILIGMRSDKKPTEVTMEKEKAVEEIIEKGIEKTKKSSPKKSKKELSIADKKINEIPAEKKIKQSKKDINSEKNAKTANKIKVKTSSKKKVTINKIVKITPEKPHDLKIDVKKIVLTDGGNEAVITIDKHTQKFTNLKKIYFEELGYTKQDVIEYYDKIAPFILPYLKDRPENLRRNPNGYKDAGFFHKDMPDTTPEWIEKVKIYSGSNEEYLNYMICQDKASLLYMANLGCIELNPWLSRKQHLDEPDYIVIDLDPQDVPFEEVINVTLAVKEVLDSGEIQGFLKTSGSRGIHIYIPLAAKYNFDQAKQFAELLASFTHELTRDITSVERSPAKRRNKIYIDFLQNRTGQTLAAPYCIRPRIGATVSTPLTWDEIKSGLSPAQFDIKTIFPRLDIKGDLFKGILGKGVDMSKALKKLNK